MGARHLALGGVILAFFVGCSGAPASWTSDDGGSPDDDSSTPDQDGSTPTKDSSTPPPKDGGTTKDATSPPKDSGTTVDSGDGFSAARQACINEINKLRTQNGHAAYTLWTSPSIDQCVDQQATYDEQHDSPHGAWLGKVYPTCNGNAQDECLGYGVSASDVVACLDSMWNERNQSNCSSCDSCNGSQLTPQVMNCQNTTTCDFYGKYGGECGHYVNMSADYFSYAACGFSTYKGQGTWATQNFK